MESKPRSYGTVKEAGTSFSSMWVTTGETFGLFYVRSSPPKARTVPGRLGLKERGSRLASRRGKASERHLDLFRGEQVHGGGTVAHRDSSDII